jgi:peroxiredoxin
LATAAVFAYAGSMIQVGADAPDFALASNEATAEGKPGKTIKLSDFRGKKNVVLAFYPHDFSSTCSREVACFRDDGVKFDHADAQVLGVSVDSIYAHKAFAEQMAIAYPLLADFHPKGAMAEAYGVYDPEKGRTRRATVVVDKAGKVRWAEDHGGNQRDDAAILEVLRKLG